MSGNTRKNQVTRLVTLRHRSIMSGALVFRKGVWHGPKTKNPWPIYNTLTAEVHAASDHAAIYADLEL